MKPLPIACILALATPAASQVQHTHEEVWTGGATQYGPFGGSSEGQSIFSALPPVMGWWLSPDWPMIRLDVRHVVAATVPADQAGAPVRYGWESYIHVNNYQDGGGPTWTGDDVYVDELTPGGTSPLVVQWERPYSRTFYSHTMMLMWGGALGDVRIVSQIGPWSALFGPQFYDAWYVDAAGDKQPLNATIAVENTATIYWTFDPPAITSWDSGAAGCGGVANATGMVGELEMGGSPDLADDSMWVSAWNLPASTFGILVGGDALWGTPTSTSVCIGGIQSFPQRLAVVQANAQGEVAYRLRSNDFPWVDPAAQFRAYFQLWHRDPTAVGSNVTNAYRVRYEPL